MIGEPLLTVEQVARRCQVSIYTVRRWIKDGVNGVLLPATLHSRQAGYKVAPAALERFQLDSRNPIQPFA